MCLDLWFSEWYCREGRSKKEMITKQKGKKRKLLAFPHLLPYSRVADILLQFIRGKREKRMGKWFLIALLSCLENAKANTVQNSGEKLSEIGTDPGAASLVIDEKRAQSHFRIFLASFYFTFTFLSFVSENRFGCQIMIECCKIGVFLPSENRCAHSFPFLAVQMNSG